MEQDLQTVGATVATAEAWIQVAVVGLVLLFVVAVAVGAGALVFLRTRSAAAAAFAAVSAGIGTLFVLVILGFFWVTLAPVRSTPPVAHRVVVAPPMPRPSEPPHRAFVAPGPKANDSPSAVPPAESGQPAEAQPAEAAPAEVPPVPAADRAAAQASATPPTAEGEPLSADRSSGKEPAEADGRASNGLSTKPPVGASPDEHQDQQALGELRRRIFERVVVALREIIAEEMSAEGANAAESALDSALSAAVDQRPIAEKPLPPPAAPPDWLSAAGSAGSGGSVVVVGPHVDLAECERHVYEAVQPVVAEFVANYLGPEWKNRVALPEEFVRTELIRDRYVETVPASFGPMVQLHLLLSFDGKVKAELTAQQLELLRRQRIGAIAAVFGGFLGCLAIAYFALRHDVAHGGHGRSGTLAWAATAGVCIALSMAAMHYLSSR